MGVSPDIAYPPLSKKLENNPYDLSNYEPCVPHVSMDVVEVDRSSQVGHHVCEGGNIQDSQQPSEPRKVLVHMAGQSINAVNDHVHKADSLNSVQKVALENCCLECVLKHCVGEALVLVA